MREIFIFFMLCILYGFINDINYSLHFTPWSRGLLEKLTVSQLVKKFPAFYGTRRFITAFTRARHLSLSWAGRLASKKKSWIGTIYFFFPSLTYVPTYCRFRELLLHLITLNQKAHTRLVGLPWTSDQPIAETST
jgi:hypothetical protein